MPIGYRGSTGWAGATQGDRGRARRCRARRRGRDRGDDAARATPGQPMQVRIAPGARGTVVIEATPPAAGSADGARHRVRGGLDRALLRPRRAAGAASTTAAPAAVETYVADGPYYADPAERAALSAFVPPQGYRPRNDATYFPIPWVLSSEGYGVLVENEETAYHDFRGDAPVVGRGHDRTGRPRRGAAARPRACGCAFSAVARRPGPCAGSRGTSADSRRRPRGGSGARGSSPAARSRSSSASSRSCSRPTLRSR